MALPRRKLTAIKVYCSESERDAIEENARRVAMSLSHFLRAVGAGYLVRSALDQQAVRDLARVNADMGRVGGLLKVLLTNEERFDGYTGQQIQQITHATLQELSDTQKQLRSIVLQITGK